MPYCQEALNKQPHLGASGASSEALAVHHAGADHGGLSRYHQLNYKKRKYGS